MESICSSSWTLANAMEQPELGVAPGAGIPWGLGLMALGTGQGVLTALNATHIQECFEEIKVVACDARDAYNSVMVDKKLGPAIGSLMAAQDQFAKATAQCKVDLNTDLPMIEEWGAFMKQPAGDIEKMITKNVLRHSFRFLEMFNVAKKTWDAHSYFWTGERLGEMLVTATQTKNVIYADEIEAGIDIDFGGEDFILQ